MIVVIPLLFPILLSLSPPQLLSSWTLGFYWQDSDRPMTMTGWFCPFVTSETTILEFPDYQKFQAYYFSTFQLFTQKLCAFLFFFFFLTRSVLSGLRCLTLEKKKMSTTCQIQKKKKHKQGIINTWTVELFRVSHVITIVTFRNWALRSNIIVMFSL